MTKYSFDIKNSQDKLKDLLSQYEEFLLDDTSGRKALGLSISSWHMVDWIFEEFKNLHNKSTIEDFRETLYPNCPSLKLMHDIATVEKHSTLSRPKANIKETRKHTGSFDSSFDDSFDTSGLEIELEDGDVLDFAEEIKKVILFWENYFKTELNITP